MLSCIFNTNIFRRGRNKVEAYDSKDIADMVGLDISTVSRVANSKYVDTPYGTKLIKGIFSEAMKTQKGEDVSTIEIKRFWNK